MKTKTFLLVILVLSNYLTLEAQSQSIKNPAYFGDIDTVFQNQKNFGIKTDIQNGKNKPYAKDKDQILGTIINDARVNFSTFLGGTGYDCCNSIISDNDGNIVVVGYTGSIDLKVTPNCYQSQRKLGHDAMIGKFTPEGQVIWLTYFGGDSTDVASDVAIDKYNNIIVFGKTNSIDLPVTVDAEQKTNAGGTDCFLAKFTTDGQLVQCTYYGGGESSGRNNDISGSGVSIQMCNDNESFVVGGTTISRSLRVTPEAYSDTLCGGWFGDAFIAKFSNDLKLTWGTYFGGNQEDTFRSLAIDKNDNIIIIGFTSTRTKTIGIKFPVTENAFQKDTAGGTECFISKFSKDGKLVYSTLYGGNARDIPLGIIIDNENNIIICGSTDSQNFPITQDAYQISLNTNINNLTTDAFILQFNENGIRKYCTYFGGSELDQLFSLTLDKDNNCWLTGITENTDLPYDKDSFINVTPADYILLVNFNSLNELKKCVVYNMGYSNKIDVNNRGNLIICGETGSGRFYIKNAYQSNIGVNLPYEPNDGILFSIDMSKTDVNEILVNDTFSLFPNPANNTFRLKYYSDVETQVVLSINDCLGNKVLSLSEPCVAGANEKTIDCTHLATGYYLVKVRCGAGVQTQGLVILK